MTMPRRSQICIAETPYYHCISRCVRRAFLCGFDRVSGQNFDHRRQWVRERLALLVEVFAIDLCAYAIMSNHYHLVLRVDPSRAESWSDREVVERWRRLCRGPEVVRRYLDGAELSPGEQARMEDLILLWRERLTDISWFMRSLNGYIAREANREDGCKGHFFEGRFKSQALLDYLQLVDDTGRAVRRGKRGVVPERSLPVLRRLGIDDRAWLRHMRPRPNYLLQAVGAVDRARRYATVTGRRWLWGIALFSGFSSGESRAGKA